MKHYPDQNGRQIPWPDDWAEPLDGANAGPLAGRIKFEALKEDIEKRGVREKIQLTTDGKIVAGRNRYRALRALKWSDERIKAEACIVVEPPKDKDFDLDATMSNIMRVNRTNLALIASYLRAKPKAFATLLKDRKNGSKSGMQAKLAAIIGCSSQTVTRFLDEITKAELRGVTHGIILEYLARDDGHSTDYPAPDQVTKIQVAGIETTSSTWHGAVGSDETEPKEVRDIPNVISRTPEKEQATQPESLKDRRTKLTPEIKAKVTEAFKGGSAKREIARVFNLSDSTVRSIVAEPDAKRKPTAEDDPVSSKLLSIWRQFGRKELKQADVPALVRSVYDLANMATLSVSLETWSTLCKQGTK